MCSPLHIRAPTRPLILQCVTELYETGLVAVPIPVVLVAKLVRVECRSAATSQRADDRTLLATDKSAEQSSCAGSGSGRYLVAMLIPN